MVFKCQEDSFLKEVIESFERFWLKSNPLHISINVSFKFESKVIICEPTSQNQKNCDGKDELVKGYNVVLDDTILFPEGGGQVSS